MAAYLNPPTGDPPNNMSSYLSELRDVSSRSRGALALVAARAQRLIGCVTYVASPTSPYAEFEDPHAAGIRMLAVAPEARGMGVGAALVRHCLARAREDGKQRVILHTTHSMNAAHRLYEKLGFQRRPELDLDLPQVYLVAYGLEL